nr:PREDICTED: uncharacterized protein LOC103548637 isoform X4 [Equus przewalskii]
MGPPHTLMDRVTLLLPSSGCISSSIVRFTQHFNCCGIRFHCIDIPNVFTDTAGQFLAVTALSTELSPPSSGPGWIPECLLRNRLVGSGQKTCRRTGFGNFIRSSTHTGRTSWPCTARSSGGRTTRPPCPTWTSSSKNYCPVMQ